MISDRKLSKTKKGLPMKLSGLQLLSIVLATTLSIIHSTEVGVDLIDTRPQFILYCISALLLMFYVMAGPTLVEMDHREVLESEESNELSCIEIPVLERR
jgi:hypothetical protein